MRTSNNLPKASLHQADQKTPEVNEMFYGG
jgi:hypothetical protein